MATARGHVEGIDDIVECPICAETFTDPRVLPCIHTFCLKCLQKYGKDNKPGDEVSCPLCRARFIVPLKGFDGLPSNYVVNKLLLRSKQLSGETTSQVHFCNVCFEANEEVKAVKFCIECNEHLCEECHKFHDELEIKKNHQVCSIKEKPLFGRIDVSGRFILCSACV
jgi:hypothetical protein